MTCNIQTRPCKARGDLASPAHLRLYQARGKTTNSWATLSRTISALLWTLHRGRQTSGDRQTRTRGSLWVHLTGQILAQAPKERSRVPTTLAVILDDLRPPELRVGGVLLQSRDDKAHLQHPQRGARQRPLTPGSASPVPNHPDALPSLQCALPTIPGPAARITINRPTSVRRQSASCDARPNKIAQQTRP